MSVLLLILALVGLALGPAVFALLHRTPAPQLALDGFVLVAVVGLVATHIIPDAFAAAGLWVVPAFGAGVLFPLALEKAQALSSRASHAIVLSLAAFALLLHAALDGVGLASADTAPGLGVAVVLHRLPVGLAVWWLVRPQFGRGWGVAVLGAVGVATLVGFAFGMNVVRPASEVWAQVIQAIVAGSLLHVLMHQSVGFHDHGIEPGRWRFPGAIGALLGAALVLVVPGADGHGFASDLLAVALASTPLLLVLYALGLASAWFRHRDGFRDLALVAVDRATPWAVVAVVFATLVGHELVIEASILNWLALVAFSLIVAVSLAHQGPRDFLLRLVPVGRHDHEHEAHEHHDETDSAVPAEPILEPS